MNPTIQDPSGRGAHRLEWARGALGDPYAQLERASMDAGFRRYWRSLGDGPGRIVMDSPPGLEDVRPWLSMRELLVGGDVRVPEVLAIDIEHGFLLLEDLGGPTMAQVMDAANARAARALCSPEHAHKLRRLTDFCTHHAAREVPDPYYGGGAGFEAVLDLVEDACDGLLRHVQRQLQAQVQPVQH